MSLTYTKTSYSGNYSRTEETVTVPQHWAMFTSAGNRSLRLKAERLLAKVEKIMAAPGYEKTTKVRAALVAFIVSWERMGNSKSYREAGDTAVRECVGDFHDEIVKATFGGGSCDWHEWENNIEVAYARIRSARKAG